MKTILFLLKTLITVTIFVFLYTFIYSIYLNKTHNNDNLIVLLILNSFTFFILGFIYSNHFNKRGLLIGIIVSLIHIIIIKIIYYLSINIIDINYLKIFILLLSGGIGGLIGSNIKKIF